MSEPRSREVIEEEIAMARAEMEDMEAALCALEAELAALPPDDVDEELWHAQRDPRQLRLPIEGRA